MKIFAVHLGMVLFVALVFKGKIIELVKWKCEQMLEYFDLYLNVLGGDQYGNYR